MCALNSIYNKGQLKVTHKMSHGILPYALMIGHFESKIYHSDIFSEKKKNVRHSSHHNIKSINTGLKQT